MHPGRDPQTTYATAELLHALTLEAEDRPSADDRLRALNAILAEARRLAHAEAGSLYVVERGRLRFVVAQNDRVPVPQIVQALLHREIPVSGHSLAGYVAATGRAMNIPDADNVPAGAPFRIHRAFDAETGYRAKSILAIPLKCPEGRTIGVLELFNRRGDGGRVGPFPSSEGSGLMSLAALAAMGVHNALLQGQLRKAHLDTIFRLSVVVELRDNETSDHIRRISHTSALLARAVGLDDRMVETIACASPMHDIGKVVIPDAILHKKARLTEAERDIVKQHPLTGAEILGEAENDLLAMAHDVALTHHERWDGGGYPRGLAGEAIPLCGRIVGLADVLDALLSRRCYKEPCSVPETLDTIRDEDGRHFDPAVSRAFFAQADSILSSYAAAAAAPA
jgi:HD-GYP domain-containing protein (c-di-GMP phosphodiesterase class II)